MTMRRLWAQLPFFAWLVVLWMMLWGQFTWLAFLTGIAIAAFVTVWFRLPTAELSGRMNPFWLAVFVVQFVWDLMRGALQVAWQAVAPRPTPTAIVRAPLRVDDDLIMTHTAVAMSLVPGTTVIESDRTRRILYFHALGPSTPEGVEAVRLEALRWEKRITRALGSRRDLDIVRRGERPFVDRLAAEAAGGDA